MISGRLGFHHEEGPSPLSPSALPGSAPSNVDPFLTRTSCSEELGGVDSNVHSHTTTTSRSDSDSHFWNWKHLLHGPTTSTSDSGTSLSRMLLEDHRINYHTPSTSPLAYFTELTQPCTENEDWKLFVETLHAETEEITELDVANTESNQCEKQIKQEENAGERKKWARFREKAFVCDYCDREFTLKQNVQCHIHTYHMKGKSVKTKKNKQFKCSKCEKVFRTMDKAERHQKKMHNPNKGMKKIFTCQLCSKVYNSSCQLQEHVDVKHLNFKPYNCDECGLLFGRKGGLRRHRLMVHLGMVYKCKYEGCEHPGYKCSKALAAHVRSVHTGDRPFECMLCERSFVRRNDLRQHELTHENHGEHQCVYCKQSFKRIIYLSKHKRTCHMRMKEYGIECKPIVRRQVPTLRTRGTDFLRETIGMRGEQNPLRRGRSAGPVPNVKEEVIDADYEKNGESVSKGESAEKTDDAWTKKHIKEEEPDDYSSAYIKVEPKESLWESESEESEEDKADDGESVEDEESTDSESDEDEED